MDAVGWANGTWSTAANTSSMVVCNKQNYTDASDDLDFWLKLQIPVDAPYGSMTNAFTFSATASSP